MERLIFFVVVIIVQSSRGSCVAKSWTSTRQECWIPCQTFLIWFSRGLCSCITPTAWTPNLVIKQISFIKLPNRSWELYILGSSRESKCVQRGSFLSGKSHEGRGKGAKPGRSGEGGLFGQNVLRPVPPSPTLANYFCVQPVVENHMISIICRGGRGTGWWVYQV